MFQRFYSTLLDWSHPDTCWKIVLKGVYKCVASLETTKEDDPQRSHHRKKHYNFDLFLSVSESIRCAIKIQYTFLFPHRITAKALITAITAMFSRVYNSDCEDLGRLMRARSSTDSCPSSGYIRFHNNMNNRLYNIKVFSQSSMLFCC